LSQPCLFVAGPVDPIFSYLIEMDVIRFWFIGVMKNWADARLVASFEEIMLKALIVTERVGLYEHYVVEAGSWFLVVTTNI